MATIPASDNVFPLVRLAEVAAPSTPPTGEAHLYVKSDGLLYWKDDAGTEFGVGGDVSTHLADTIDAHDASAISFTPAGSIAAIDVQAAIVEVAAEAGTGGSMEQTRISVTPTVSTSPAYTAKDAVGGILTFASAVLSSGGTGIIQTVIVVDKSQQMPALDLVLFDQTIAGTVTDNSPFDPTDADLANSIGVIPVAAWSDLSDNAVAVRAGLGLAFKANATSIFGALVTRSTPTFVSTSDITVILEILQDA